MLEPVVGPLLHGELLKAVRADEICRRLMTIAGVAGAVATTFKGAVDQPEPSALQARGRHFGLPPRKYQ